MYVILDTNVIIKDYYFKSKAFKVLFEYLSKTRHKLIIPKIVIDELKQRYFEDTTLLYSSINKQVFDLKSITNTDYNIKIFSPEDELSKYSFFLDDFIEKNKIIIIDYDDKHYRKIVSRSLSKKLPFITTKDHSDYGFKDAIIWEQIKDIVEDTKYEFVAFISKNIHQFSDSKKENLNEILYEEVKKYKEKFIYLSSLESFLEKYCEKISKISLSDLEKVLNDSIPQNHFSQEYFKNVFEDGLIKDAENIFIDEAEIRNFYVFKADEKNLYVQSVGLAKIWIIYNDTEIGECYGDCLYTNFNASFKVTKNGYNISLVDFNLEKTEIIGS